MYLTSVISQASGNKTRQNKAARRLAAAVVKPFFACLLFLLCFEPSSEAQHVFLYTEDSVKTQRPQWLFIDGDKPEYALPAYNDSGMPLVYTRSIQPRGGNPSPFKGIGWFRLHFRLDSALGSRPVAFGLTQGGACELFLDGKKIYERGKVDKADKAIYYDPQYYPIHVLIGDTLPHLLAMRYANWNYNNNSYLYKGELPGFEFYINDGQEATDTYVGEVSFNGVFSCIMFGMFAILAILHFLFFLYYRQEVSNLWFSLFCAALATLLLLPYASRVTTSLRLELIIDYYSFFLALLTCFALSGFLNRLFSSNPLRFRIITAFYLLNALLYIFVEDTQGYLIFGLIIVTTLEAIIVISGAIIRRVPGARIIGAGLGLFVLTLLFVIMVSIFRQRINIQLHGTQGNIVLAVVCLILLSIPVSLSAYLALRFAHVSRSLNQRLRQVEELSQKNLEQEAEKQRILAHQNEVLEREVTARTGEVMRQKTEIEQQHAALVEEKKKSDDLLLNILPTEVAEELKQKGSSAARQYDQVSVLFTDIVDFTILAQQMDPQELVRELNECFTAFDAIIERHGLEKIKTIGDAYMAVCGLPVSDPRHAQKTVQAALEIRDLTASRSLQTHAFQIRIGINSGPVVAGIVGVKKFAYDIWGDTVNTAARMEQHGEAGKINISAATYGLVKDAFICTPRGRVAAKSKGEVEMYFVEAPVMEPA